MNAILVSVNYTDLLSITLGWNRHHFDKVLIVSSIQDQHNVAPLCRKHNALLYGTDAFYANGATFNKWAALEEALDVMGYRKGWLCIMDADVLWPKTVSIYEGSCNGLFITNSLSSGRSNQIVVKPGQLCSPLRRMYTNIQHPFQVPKEYLWKECPLHRNIAEWAGYSQIFHASDPVLNQCASCGLTKEEHLGHSSDCPCPKFVWHQTDWKHAGGADSFFQAKWNPSNKVRPDWECLHIGEAGKNWFGRSSKNILTGEIPADVNKKQEQYMEIWETRRRRRASGLDPFGPERIKKD